MQRWILMTATLLSIFSCTSSMELSKIQQRKEISKLVEKEQTPPAEEIKESQVPQHISNKDITDTEFKITIGQLSRELKTNPYHLNAQSKLLAKYLNTKRMPTNLCDGNRPLKERNRILCRFLWEIERRKNEKSADHRSASRRTRRGRIRLQKSRIHQHQRYAFNDIMRAMEKVSDHTLLQWSDTMTKSRPCPRNLSAATIRHLEGLLPSNSAKKAIEKLYAHTSTCLQQTDSAYFITHFRQALLRYMWGDRSRALRSIERALQAKTKMESSRALFWAGLLETSHQKRAKHWSKLIKEHPMSYHALEVWRINKKDPFAWVTQRPQVLPSRLGNKKNSLAQLSIRWLEALYLNKERNAAVRLSNWISKTFRDDLSAGNMLYISALKEARATKLDTIRFLASQIHENPEFLNQQTLEILYPLSYWETFDNASPNTDTFLVMSVARQESAFNPRARSRANAKGLLQILPATAQRISGRKYNNLYNPKTNAKIGVKFLSQLIDRFGSVEKALMAYNAGPNRIKEWEKRYPTKSTLLMIDLIPFKETRNYVSSILRNNYWYHRLYGEDKNLARVSLRNTQHSNTVRKMVRATKNGIAFRTQL